MLLRAEIAARLATVEDPELRCDIVALGLIYNIEVVNQQAIITLTWTMLGCPLTDLLEKRIRRAVLASSAIELIALRVVWTPRWHKDMMTPYAKMLLGVK
ncbi:metal-sulfur cluster assembly factor [Weissella soli]|uniref:metal-sulfur cluster assembly factor n=1 Tax=Weissella soli TaxID=155866 RepID=UPI0035A163A9